jgi:hypothetical protein
MARVDFFVRADGEVVVNELNTIPASRRRACTRSCSPRAGFPYPALLDRLVALALERHEQRRHLDTEPLRDRSEGVFPRRERLFEDARPRSSAGRAP